MVEAFVKLGPRGQILLPPEIRHTLQWKLGSRLKMIQRGKELKLEAVESEAPTDPNQLLKEWLQNPVEVEPTDSVKEHDLVF